VRRDTADAVEYPDDEAQISDAASRTQAARHGQAERGARRSSTKSGDGEEHETTEVLEGESESEAEAEPEAHQEKNTTTHVGGAGGAVLRELVRVVQRLELWGMKGH
jgi:hypothetical protein